MEKLINKILDNYYREQLINKMKSLLHFYNKELDYIEDDSLSETNTKKDVWRELNVGLISKSSIDANKVISNGIFYDIAVNVKYNDTTIRFSWLLPYSLTQPGGKSIASIEFYGYNEFNNRKNIKTSR